MHRPISFLAALWACSGSLMFATEWSSYTTSVQALNAVVMTVGGTLILLYQRKLSVQRENANAVERQVSRDAFDEVHARLDAVIKQRDHESQRNDQLAEQLAYLAELSERYRCVFPIGDGARCKGRIDPPS